MVVLSWAARAAAQETGHYPPGVEGIKAATVPGPGQYLKWYNLYYEANTLKDRNGDSVPVNFSADVFATAPRFIWITDTKILGADYGFDALVPILHSDVQIPGAGIGGRETAFGDLYIEPLLLGWHGDQYDVGAAAGFWAPTGDFDRGSPASAGKGYWTGMFTLGSTLYLDAEKTWSVSALGRYELNSRKQHVDIRPGDLFHIEWGVAKTIDKVWDVGVSGYCNWQLTDDRGSAVTYDRNIHDQFYSVGPEVNYFHAPLGMAFQLRYQWEFAARDRPQGRNLVFNVVKVLGSSKKEDPCKTCH